MNGLKRNISMIVPSAGMSRRLFPLSSNIPKILIKLNGVPLFSLLYKQAVDTGCINFIVAISAEFEHQVREFIECNYANAPIPIIIKVVDKPSEGVLYSVFTALCAPECADQALIVLSDTFYNAPFPKEESYVIYQDVEPPLNRWCLIETMFNYNYTEEKVNCFHDKPIGEVTTTKALIGVYKVKTMDFLNCAFAISLKHIKLRGEYQLSQALETYMNTCAIVAIKATKGAWNDTGTLETLREASNDFFLSRCFNHIKIEDGKLIKSSTKKDVIQKQYLWYQNFQQKDLIPTIYGYSESLDKAYLSMELCAMPDLGTYFNYCTAEPVFFEQTIQYILEILDKRLWINPVLNSQECIEANKEMFLTKMLDRIELCPEFNFDFITNDFITELKQIAGLGYCVPIHGDLILSNILFDPQRMTIKLIDPRGQYGCLGMYGSLLYDLAKLLHSCDGKYESIIHNLYTIKGNELKFFMSENKQKCFDAAQETIFNFALEQYGIQRRDLKCIEASLFLSMLPLHSENKSHQEAFLLIAKRLLKELYENRV
jgi:UTP-glucose-1-phosphate uridylyltransferase